MHRRRNTLAIVLVTGLATLIPSGTSPRAGDSGHGIRIRDAGKVRIVTTDQDGNRQVEVHDVFGGSGVWLGVGLDRHGFEGSGARVEHVVDGSPADRAGLRDGDVIVGLDGSSVDDPDALTELLRAREPGDDVELRIERDGHSQTLSVELGERSGNWDFNFDLGDLHGFDAEAFGEQMRKLGEDLGSGFRFDLGDLGDLEGFDAEAFGEQMRELGEQLGEMKLNLGGLGGHYRFHYAGHRPRLGVELVATTPELREHLGGSRDAGVLVGKVLAGTPAETAGVRVGDLIVAVDGREVEDAGDLIEALADRAGESVELQLVRDGSTLRLDVALEAEDDAPAGDRASRYDYHYRFDNTAARNMARAARASARSTARAARAVAAGQAAAARRMVESYRRTMPRNADLSETF